MSSQQPEPEIERAATWSDEWGWLTRGERDPQTGIHSHDVIREAAHWWQKTGRALVTEQMFRKSPPNKRPAPNVGIMAGISWDYATIEEQFRIVISYYQGHYLIPHLKARGLS